MKKRTLGIILIITMLFSAVVTVPVTVGATSVKASDTTSYIAKRDIRWADTLGLTLGELDSLKNAIYNTLFNVEESVDISSYSIPYDSNDERTWVTLCEISESFNDIFYRKNTSANIVSDGKGKNTFNSLKFIYEYDKDQCVKMYSECLDAANYLIKGLDNPLLGDVEKALILHDRIASWCEYDEINYNLGTVPFISHTMYAALVNKVAVCQGYAYAYEWLLSMVGIKSHTCSSDSLMHIWNVVKINGKEYNVDITYDDPIPDTYGLVYHDFFLKSYSSFSSDFVHEANDYAIYQENTTDTSYDFGYLWDDSFSDFKLLNGSIYYIDVYKMTLCRYDGANSKTVLKDISDKWRASADSVWQGFYSRLSCDDNNLYYTSHDKIYAFDTKTNSSSEIYDPELTDNYSIFGFKTENGFLYYEQNNTPNDKENATVVVIPYLKGDTNGDGSVNAVDRINYSRYIAEWNDCSIIERLSDFNGDGKCTQADRIILSRYIAGWIGYDEYFK